MFHNLYLLYIKDKFDNHKYIKMIIIVVKDYHSGTVFHHYVFQRMFMLKSL